MRCRAASVLLSVALAVACSDSNAPENRLTLEQVIAEPACIAGTITSVDEDQLRAGRVDDEDCRTVQLEPNIPETRGRVEVWSVPQSAFGADEVIVIGLQADFDGVILLIDEDGELIWVQDEDDGGDRGSEETVLFFDDDPALGDYYVGVFAYGGEPEGDYSIAFSGQIAP